MKSFLEDAFFREGVRDAIPVSVSYMFLFFSVGSLCAGAGYSALQAGLMSVFVFAAPLQIFIMQNGEAITFAMLLLASVMINFRFVVMSSVLGSRLNGIPPAKALAATFLMSASTFVVSNSKEDASPTELLRYHTGVGALSIGTALIATLSGTMFAGELDGPLTKVVGMILPIHFATLTGLQWPKLKPVFITITAAVLSPILGKFAGDAQVFILPFALAACVMAGDMVAEAVRE
ncbi:AzlC family ABC transporter permease [Caballeronia sp. LZ034LL]|uniref:AzlC family ABC transporter permease n=1 Tax=Caballeronia sp. LZ034LL TaxID=3038567 RepID=UPI00285C73E5|nr:AzlC family ABC transporter permease [Caballeronia sp. LZ034LL]MDR5836657.1 AzlC family ABC transporter permease [Caballeronia sp. LZ034LL]